jgi:hypothetical protein
MSQIFVRIFFVTFTKVGESGCSVFQQFGWIAARPVWRAGQAYSPFIYLGTWRVSAGSDLR